MNLARNAYTVYRDLPNRGMLRYVSVVASNNANKAEKKRKVTPRISEIELEMKEHASKMNPEDYEYLNKTLIKRIHQRKTRGDHDILREARISLWDYLMSYQKHFDEKSLLVDRHVASRIATAILANSDTKNNIPRNENDMQSIFVDANGGLCRVTDEIIKQCNNTNHVFSCFKIFEKDVNLVPALQRARNDYLKSKKETPGNVISIMNVNQIVSHYMSCKQKSEFLSEFYQRVLVNYPAKPWSESAPVYTLYMTATHGTIKYFTTACLNRYEMSLNEMSRGRPEFFFIITPKTWAALTLGKCLQNERVKRLQTPKNILFNLLFEYKLLDVLPRKSFIPWPKKGKEKESKAREHTKEIQRLEENLYFIKARPKVDLGIVYNSSDEKIAYPPAHWLEYFVHAICRDKIDARFLPILDKWHPSAALHCVRKGLVPVYMQLGDFLTSPDVAEKIIPVFNSLLLQKNIHLANFAVMADAYRDGELRYDGGEHHRQLINSDESSIDFSAKFRTEDESDDFFEDDVI